uniref:ATP synthase complex subunit 8 n=1 Tax=Oplophorus typus TaxID=727950 RepID=A0A5P8DQZ1_9EUCA|nr:ATP synthase F0 subunit 8 [Oplophorus typus]QUL61614.1 ATP synthase F0 subunit 8 [Oplophorus typus]
MPQMAPLLWLNLLLFSSVVFLLFVISNYFIKTPSKMEKTSSTPQSNHLNWKW